MTTNSEQQQAIWYVSGLAEVLAGPESPEQTDDTVIRFDRRRGTHPPHPMNSSSNTLSSTARRRLDQWGYVVIGGVENRSTAEELVNSVGQLIDPRSYSRDVDTISVHTEAPGCDPNPAYLALFCQRQRRRRAAHTDLLDVRKLVGALDTGELALMTEAELHFPGQGGGVDTTMLSTDTDGNTVTRFSYGLLTADGPLGEAGDRLAHRISDLFGELHTSVVIPSQSLLIWDNQRMLHARPERHDRPRQLTEIWSTDWRRP